MKKEYILILLFFVPMTFFSQEKLGKPFFTGAANLTFGINEGYTLDPDDGEPLIIPSAILLRMGFGYEFKRDLR